MLELAGVELLNQAVIGETSTHIPALPCILTPHLLLFHPPRPFLPCQCWIYHPPCRSSPLGSIIHLVDLACPRSRIPATASLPHILYPSRIYLTVVGLPRVYLTISSPSYISLSNFRLQIRIQYPLSLAHYILPMSIPHLWLLILQVTL